MYGICIRLWFPHAFWKSHPFTPSLEIILEKREYIHYIAAYKNSFVKQTIAGTKRISSHSVTPTLSEVETPPSKPLPIQIYFSLLSHTIRKRVSALIRHPLHFFFFADLSFFFPVFLSFVLSFFFFFFSFEGFFTSSGSTGSSVSKRPSGSKSLVNDDSSSSSKVPAAADGLEGSDGIEGADGLEGSDGTGGSDANDRLRFTGFGSSSFLSPRPDIFKHKI